MRTPNVIAWTSSRKVVSILAIMMPQMYAFGQSINVDFGSGRGTPDASYSGAGDSGFWNNITPRDSNSFTLSDTAGNSAGVGIEFGGFDFDVTPTVTVPVGAWSELLGDYAVGRSNTGSLQLTGMTPGVYDVFVYKVGRQDFPTVGSVTILGDTQEITGVFAGQLAEGVTHSRHRVHITDGTLDISVFGSNDVVSNGLQLVLVPAPSTAALLLVGGVAVARRRRG